MVAEAFARRYKVLNNNTSNVYKDWFDENDKFNYDNFKKSTIFSDGINGIWHGSYRGRVYRLNGENGQPLYYNAIPEGYKVKEGDPELAESGLYNIYDLIAPEKETPESEEERKTRLGETVIPDMPEPSLISRGEKVLNTLGINSLRALRLASSL